MAVLSRRLPLDGIGPRLEPARDVDVHRAFVTPLQMGERPERNAHAVPPDEPHAGHGEG